MAQSLSKVYVHIIFSTKNRLNIIDQSIQKDLHEYIGGICKNIECYPIRVGGHTDHIHILCVLSKKITQIKLLEEIKKNSSIWIKNKNEIYKDFYWQNGYGIFSVKPTDTDSITNYIINQSEHHRKKTFQEEFRSFLIENNIDFDERYVWD